MYPNFSPFLSPPPKKKKNVRKPEVFRGYRDGTLDFNGLLVFSVISGKDF